MLLANDMWMDVGHTAAMVKLRRNRAGHIESTSKQPQWAEGERLYLGEWLEALNIRPAKVAAAAEVNEGYLSQLINGNKTNASPAFVRRIAAEIGIPWRALYDPPPTAATIAEITKYGPELLERLGRVKKSKG